MPWPFQFTKKNIPEITPEEDRRQLLDQITQEVEQKYRENFNFSCLFQEQTEDGIITKYASPFACLLVIVNIIISFTK